MTWRKQLKTSQFKFHHLITMKISPQVSTTCSRKISCSIFMRDIDDIIFCTPINMISCIVTLFALCSTPNKYRCYDFYNPVYKWHMHRCTDGRYLHPRQRLLWHWLIQICHIRFLWRLCRNSHYQCSMPSYLK